MELYIDTREPKQIINYINSLNLMAKDNEKIEIIIQNLDVGDYLFYDSCTKTPIFLIERKSLNDLESSIKDGRYNEQSLRLDKYDLANHNIYYLIEGSIINYKNAHFKNTLYSSLFSISYYKGFSLINSINAIESGELIYNFCNKCLREKMKDKNKVPYYALPTDLIKDISNNQSTNLNHIQQNTTNYEDVIKIQKKANINANNINLIMLMQIPGISQASANCILKEFKTIKNLINSLEENVNCLNSLKLENNRKLNKNIITNIIEFLLNS